MRAALAPMSLRPTREVERTSTTEPPFTPGRMRMATSSLKPNQKVSAVASMTPPAGSEVARVQPWALASASAPWASLARCAARARGRTRV